VRRSVLPARSAGSSQVFVTFRVDFGHRRRPEMERIGLGWVLASGSGAFAVDEAEPLAVPDVGFPAAPAARSHLRPEILSHDLFRTNRGWNQ